MNPSVHITPEASEHIAQWAASDAPTIRAEATIIPGTEDTRAKTRTMLTEAAADDPDSQQLLRMLLRSP